MKCFNCNKDIVENSKFCKYCGAKQPEKQHKEARTCPHCSRPNSPESKFCIYCGSSLIPSSIVNKSTSKRLPVVFCLDVSPSMGWRIGGNSSSIDLLNSSVQRFFQELNSDPKAKASVEAAFVTFSTEIEADTNFTSVGRMEVPVFHPVQEGGTSLSMAVIRSIEKLESRKKELEDLEISYYPPFLVLVTDGNPDKNDDAARYMKALEKLKEHCGPQSSAKDIIIPFIIGVGDHIDSDTLNNYTAGFTKGYFPIRGTVPELEKKFQYVFQLIGDSTKKSIHLNASQTNILNSIRNDMNRLLEEMN